MRRCEDRRASLQFCAEWVDGVLGKASKYIGYGDEGAEEQNWENYIGKNKRLSIPCSGRLEGDFTRNGDCV